VSDVAGWAAAWTREEVCECTQRMRAHTLFRDLDGGTPGNAFLEQMRLFSDTSVPVVDRLSDATTVVRRPFKICSMRTYGQRRVQMTASSYMAPAREFFVLSPPYLEHACHNRPRFYLGCVRSWIGALERGRDAGESG